MARIKTSRDFPEYFHQLFTASLETKVEFVADTEKEAISLQHQLHRFRRVCETENLPVARRYREITVSRSGARITLRNSMDKIRQALAEVGQASESPIDLDAYIRQSEQKSLGEETNDSEDQRNKGYEPFFRPTGPGSSKVRGTKKKEESEESDE